MSETGSLRTSLFRLEDQRDRALGGTRIRALEAPQRERPEAKWDRFSKGYLGGAVWKNYRGLYDLNINQTTNFKRETASPGPEKKRNHQKVLTLTQGLVSQTQICFSASPKTGGCHPAVFSMRAIWVELSLAKTQYTVLFTNGAWVTSAFSAPPGFQSFIFVVKKRSVSKAGPPRDRPVFSSGHLA